MSFGGQPERLAWTVQFLDLLPNARRRRFGRKLAVPSGVLGFHSGHRELRTLGLPTGSYAVWDHRYAPIRSRCLLRLFGVATRGSAGIRRQFLGRA